MKGALNQMSKIRKVKGSFFSPDKHTFEKTARLVNLAAFHLLVEKIEKSQLGTMCLDPKKKWELKLGTDELCGLSGDQLSLFARYLILETGIEGFFCYNEDGSLEGMLFSFKEDSK